MDGRLVRQDDLLSFGDSTFQVVMCEPVLQGIASQEDTEVFVTYDGQAEDINEQTGMSNLSRSSAINGIHDTSNIVVDEHFFTKGVLDSLESNVDGTAGGSLFTDTSGTNFQPFPVQDIGVIKDALRSWSSRAWRDMSGFDVDNCILLDESTFPQLGSFEGDWALVEVENEGKARAVKILCAPRGFQAQLQHQAQQGKLIGVNPSSPFAFLSPLLLQNLYHIGQFDPSRDTAKAITLRSLGSWQMTNTTQNRSDALPDCPLPLPFADSLTISRIAGPLSINRKYQNLFLGALRTYFEGGRRIVQQGDIFAVTFDKSKIRWAVDDGNEDDTGDKNKNSTNNDEEAYDITLPAPGHQNSSQSTGVVYFCVSDVTPEVSEPISNNDGQPMQTDLWIHEMARTGQFGCAVDTMLTKMVQSGVTHSRVIDSQQWLSTASDTPPLPFTPSPLTTAESVFGRLLLLVKATLLPDAADYGLHLSVLLKGARGCGKRTIARWVAQKTGVHIVELNCYDLIADTDARTEGILRARFEQAAGCAPAILLLRHVEALARKSQALETGQEPTMTTVLQDCMTNASTNTQAPSPIAVIGTTGDADRCPTGVLACFRHELNFEAPNEAERRAILDTCLRDSTLSVDVSLKSMATQTAALVASDLVDLVGRARMAAIERVTKQEGEADVAGNTTSNNHLDPSIVEAGVALTGNDFDVALNKARLSYSENIGAPKIPNVTWDDVGGLISVKDDILDTIQLPLEHPELFSDGLKKRSGILLYGPPGTGKTLLAKAVATSCSLNFFSVKGPELLNMYIGESEANVRRVFQRARDAKPCVIFFDELDSIAPKRGNQGDSGGVMDRIVSQLLAELDGMSSGSSTADVFVIGATNRPDLLDPALLRPGRFDRMLYLAVSQTHSEQLNILQALTRKFKLDEDVGDLSVIAEQCPMNLTGADFYALCSDAMLKSMTRKAEWIDGQVALLNEEIKDKAEQAAKNGVPFESDHPIPLTPQYYLDEIVSPSDLDVKVSRVDFEAALSELVPSVSSQEMEHYRSVQQKFSNTDSKSETEDQPTKKSKGKGKAKAVD
ncbi:AAA-domain-containing protein [Meira miltonrushii]|uniref:Peroxisomal ATPase PEX6 n=1 Tax=Meira miltonrushii TaxID=1280837 RepID=A0A316VDE3_9BASI|nr:AAA-domain-containing protein [Meira miltonrushii]PWN35576.1 AAA-domain-containing protein [Meira miltonrushii]